MYEDLIKLTEEAIQTSINWAENGWAVTFGPRQTEVKSLKEAEEMPKTFVYRAEAINYWNQAQMTGFDAGESGKLALESLKKGDLKDAEDRLYYCQYIEKPFAEFSNTWVSVHEAAKSQLANG